MENISTKDITKLMIKAMINLISVENTNRQTIAGRILIMDLYKQASRNRNISIQDIVSSTNFKNHFLEYIAQKKYYQNFVNYYSIEEIGKAGAYLKADYDNEYNYTTVLMLKKRYLLNPNNIINELPQEMYMAIALFLAIPENPENRLKYSFSNLRCLCHSKNIITDSNIYECQDKFSSIIKLFQTQC